MYISGRHIEKVNTRMCFLIPVKVFLYICHTVEMTIMNDSLDIINLN